MRCKPDVDPLVRSADPPGVFEHMGDEESEADRKRCDRRESQEHCNGEARHRMQTSERLGEPLRPAAVSRTENRQIPLFG